MKKKNKIMNVTKDVVGMGFGLGVASGIVIGGKSIVPESATGMIGPMATAGYGMAILDTINESSNKLKKKGGKKW